MLTAEMARAAGKRAAGATRLARAVALRLAPLAPLVIVAVGLLVTARIYYLEQHYYDAGALYRRIAAFADIGTISGTHLGLQGLAMNKNPVGFDGQFFYFIALDPKQPLICATHTPNCALDDAFGIVRAERLLYPYTAGLLTLGHADWVPYPLLLVNFASILITAWLVGRMCVEAGASRWLGAVAALYTGEIQGFLRDLADPFAVLWVVLAVYLLRTGRYLAFALAVAAALLTREQLILTIPLLYLPLLVARRWRTFAAALAIGFGPFVALQVALRVIWGRWALASGDTQGAGVGNGILPLPFHGLFESGMQIESGMMLAFVVAPLVAACGASLLALWHAHQVDGWQGVLTDPVPLFILAYSLLLSLTSTILWHDMWTPSRLAA
ncbi:MAG: hypothetical protein ACHQ4H_18285, partial [Ktedonobacterales bacterium]